MSTFQWLASFVLAATFVPAFPEESGCPGNVISVPLHLTNRDTPQRRIRRGHRFRSGTTRSG